MSSLLRFKDITLERAVMATPAPTRRSLSDVTLELDVDATGHEPRVIVARHASEAITFHVPVSGSDGARRGGRRVERFSIAAPGATAVTRGSFTRNVIKLFVLKIAGGIADRLLPRLAERVEEGLWKRRKLPHGWLRVTADGLRTNALQTVDLRKVPQLAQRNLLFIHGTFSDTHGAFAGLASTPTLGGANFFEAMRSTYGDRIYAFNHFTVSKSPEENARALLEGLPSTPTSFDVVTHSRGGLVLRHLTERRGLFQGMADRFRLNRAVLVASPNEGTPLASAARWDQFIQWFANVLEVVPENAFTFGADLVAEALSWLAHRVTGGLPGLAAMDPHGEVIRELRMDPGPAHGSYAALVSNYSPDPSWLRRLTDLSVDAFFGMANDLVVPSAGGWSVGSASLLPSRVACFGRGGNVELDGVSHVEFFQKRQTAEIIAQALRHDPPTFPPIDLTRELPTSARRGVAPGRAESEPRMAQPNAPTPADQAPLRRSPREAPLFEEVFRVMVIRAAPDKRSPAESTPQAQVAAAIRAGSRLQILATFRNATVAEEFTAAADTALRRVLEKQQTIRGFFEGDPQATKLPEGKALIELGAEIFDALFTGEVKRLYDGARAVQDGARLNVIFTSMVDWLSDVPWEFAYDRSRATFLATREVNFVRNVQTAVPADRLRPCAGTLRILVAVAQPMGTSKLSTEYEEQVIRSGFRHLIDQGMAVVDVMLGATPDRLQRRLEDPRLEGVDILHFVGHGEYDGERNLGYLLFESEDGGIQRLDSQTLQQIVCQRSIRLVFLNACETGRGGVSDFNRGVAPALVAGGVPAVVANQYSVLDLAATAFARHFYWSLATGQTIGDAAREARVAVNHSIDGEAIDWAVPVVFARNPCDVLVTARVMPTLAEVESAARAEMILRRRTTRGARRAVHIGLWDAHRMISNLDEIADRLTDAQEMFAFRAVTFPAPLGTWRRVLTRDGKDGEKVAYLHAERVADRLARKPAELGVDRLFCITNLPLRDNKILNLYGWDEDPERRVSIFSTSGLLEQLEPPTFTLERTIANMCAASLSDRDTHTHSPTCMLYYNGRRRIEFIAGPLKICAADRRALRRDPARLDAIERMLAIYQ